MIKRMLAVLLILFCVPGVLSGCGSRPSADDDRLSIVCTIAPVYDWIGEIVGEREELFEISCISGGGDLHSFQPTAQDMSKILKSDLFVTVGGESEEWTNKLTFSGKTKKIELLDIVPDSRLICMDEDHHHHGDIHTADEHIWLSLKLAQTVIEGICGAICDIDTANGVIYQKNATDYIEKLKALDKKYTDEANKHDEKVLVFADRFPFAYMMQDYGISYYAAFPGCSTDADASFETVTKLCEAVEVHKKQTVIELENSNSSITSAIKAALPDAGITAVVMDSCQSVNGARLDTFDYIRVMEQNLEAMSKALE